MENVKRIILGITGASGSIYSEKIVNHLTNEHLLNEIELHIVITDNGRQVFQYERGKPFETIACAKNVIIHKNDNMFVSIASGSFQTLGMIIAPCSMATVGKISAGIGDTVLTRAADVCLKEGRKLVVCPRETPLNKNHLKNLLNLCEAGAQIVPLIPSFYNRPQTIDDLVWESVGRILNMFGFQNELYKEWGQL